MRRTRLLAPLLVISLGLLAANPGASSSRDHGPVYPVGPNGGRQEAPMLSPDSAGGAMIAWQNSEGAASLPRLLRLEAYGGTYPTWVPDGVATIAATEPRYLSSLISDGAGGAFVSFVSDELDSNLTRVQHVGITGPDAAWPDSGVRVSTLPKPQSYPALTSDGRGGVFVAWQQGGYSDGEIRVQHLHSDGGADARFGTTGVRLGETRIAPSIIPDGSGGALVLFGDRNQRVLLARVDSTGNAPPGWPATGRALPLITTFGQALLSDGHGGAYVVSDGYSYGPPAIVHVLHDGVLDPAWQPAGTAAAIASAWRQNFGLATDGAGGVILTWIEWRGDPNTQDPEVRAQRILADGRVDPRWPGDGVVVSAGRTHEWWPVIAADSRGGAWIGWQSFYSGPGDADDVYAQHILGDGSAPTGSQFGGFTIADTAGRQEGLALVTVEGGVLAAWTDGQRDLGDVYARLLPDDGTAPAAPAPGARFAFRSLGPNPTHGTLQVVLELPTALEVGVAIFDAAGRRVRTLLERGPHSPGTLALVWDGRDDSGHALRGGVYTVVALGSRTRLGRAVTLVR